MRRSLILPITGLLPVILASNAVAHDLNSTPGGKDSNVLGDIVIGGRGDDLLEQASSGSEGTVGPIELGQRPLARPGEVMEAVPGMIITQHTGGGKANQYYLRGFNLDHGTDFATFLDGVPVNMPTHAHGPGYTDMNWVIPELIRGVHYEKGPYAAEYGDFANVGAANVEYYTVLPNDLASVQAGGFGYNRALVAAAPKLGDGHLLYALEAAHFDGAWSVKNDYRRTNGLLKWSAGDDDNGYSLAAQGYQGSWDGVDQIPQRAIDRGELGRFDAIDPTTGGLTHRFSLYGDWHRQSDASATRVLAYAMRYDLDLYSNFTYDLDQQHGDQIEQKDQRAVAGVAVSHSLYGKLLDHDVENTLGLQMRQDTIDLELSNDQGRQVLSRVRTDHVQQQNLAPWLQNKTRWLSWFRTTAGVRADTFDFLVDSKLNSANSGHRTATAVSPKLSLIFGPWAKTEGYLQGGLGIRSNDARGVTEKVLPDGSAPARALEPIAHSRGAEVGMRSSLVPGLRATMAVWTLLSDSEVYFSGDSGASVDTGRPSRRVGFEWTNFYNYGGWLIVDADYATSQARYTDHKATGDHVPETIKTMTSLGISGRNLGPDKAILASFRVRYLGARDLVADGRETSRPSMVLNAGGGYEINTRLTATLEVLNLANAKYNDNEYVYESRLSGEPDGPGPNKGYNDRMVHAGEPRSVRAGLTWTL